MERASAYRLHAEHCRALAKTAADRFVRHALGEAAEQWEKLAELTKLYASSPLKSQRAELGPQSGKSLPATGAALPFAVAHRDLERINGRIVQQSYLAARLDQSANPGRLALEILQNYLAYRATIISRLRFLLFREPAEQMPALCKHDADGSAAEERPADQASSGSGRGTEALLAIFRDAFRPLRCDAKIAEHGKRLQITVYDLHGKAMNPEGNYPLSELQFDRNIQRRINDARTLYALQVPVELEPWSLTPASSRHP